MGRHSIKNPEGTTYGIVHFQRPRGGDAHVAGAAIGWYMVVDHYNGVITRYYLMNAHK